MGIAMFIWCMWEDVVMIKVRQETDLAYRKGGEKLVTY
jgi:hypothetical protein